MDKTKIQALLNGMPEIISPAIMWIIFSIAFVVTLIFSIAIIYHFREYASAHHKRLVLAEKIFIVVTTVILLCALALLIIFTI